MTAARRARRGCQHQARRRGGLSVDRDELGALRDGEVHHPEHGEARPPCPRELLYLCAVGWSRRAPPEQHERSEHVSRAAKVSGLRSSSSRPTRTRIHEELHNTVTNSAVAMARRWEGWEGLDCTEASSRHAFNGADLNAQGFCPFRCTLEYVECCGARSCPPVLLTAGSLATDVDR